MTLAPGEARYQGTRDQEAVEWSSLAGQMKSRYCPKKHCSRLGMWCENHPLIFKVPNLVISMNAYPLRSWQKAVCSYPVLHRILHAHPPTSPRHEFFFPYSNGFNITSWLGTCSWFISLLTMVQKNRLLGVARRIRSWILMLVGLTSENFPRSLNFLLSSWTLVQPLNGGIWIFKNFFWNRVLWNGWLSSGRYRVNLW